MAISKTHAKFTKNGYTIDYTPNADVASGAIKIVAGLICIALSPIAANTMGTLKVLQRGDVVTITTDEAIGATTAGTKVYVTSAGIVTKTDTNNTLIGQTARAVAAGDLTFDIVCA